MRKRCAALFMAMFLLVPQLTICTTVSATGKTLGITKFDFYVTYAIIMEKMKQEAKLDIYEETDEHVILTLTDYSSIMLYLHDDEVSQVLHIGSGDGTIASGNSILISMAATIMSIDPSISSDNVMDIIKAFSNGETEYKTEYCSYSYLQDKSIGTWLGIEPV